MRALITGATGYAGSHLARHLVESGDETHIVTRPGSDWGRIEDIRDRVQAFVYTGQLTDLTAYMESHGAFDAVFYIAAAAGYDDAPVDDYLQGNIVFGTHLLEAMARTECGIFINTGTVWVHGQNRDYDPVCLYAATKAAFGKIIDYYAQARGIKAITLEMYDSYGEDDIRPKLVQLLRQAARTGVPLDTTPGEQPIALVHIDDITAGYVRAYELASQMRAPAQETYVLDADGAVTVKELIGRMEKIWGRPVPVNLGVKPYREREVMTLWDKGVRLPGWKPDIGLNEGLGRLGHF
jgi:nucleoside-diphosphate-sugar epimerase